MKKWLIQQIAGPLGFIVRPIISGIVGTIVALIYEQAWIVVYKIPWLHFFAVKVVATMSANEQGAAALAMLTPGAVGGFVALAVWGFVPDWIIAKLRGGNKQLQEKISGSNLPISVEHDGIILKDGQTVNAVGNIISRAEYEAIMPDDTTNRGGDGMPEIRRPLPN